MNLHKVWSREELKSAARQSNEGNIYSLTNIDLKNKRVINGSDLGKSSAQSQCLRN